MPQQPYTATPAAPWVIGDIHGCFHSLLSLVEKIPEERPTLWHVGDLVNRGPRSLATLRWAMQQGDRFRMVLGNHDLHLLAVSQGVRAQHAGDTISEILQAPDCDKLIDWLRHQPLAYKGHGWLMVHAGVLPQWTENAVLALAQEAEAVLRSHQWVDQLKALYGNEPATWSNNLRAASRLRVIMNGLTRLRWCTAEGKMDLRNKGAHRVNGPSEETYFPWFSAPRRACKASVIFGHWSARGLIQEAGIVGLDTGCVWGGHLSAMQLSSGKLLQVPNIDTITKKMSSGPKDPITCF